MARSYFLSIANLKAEFPELQLNLKDLCGRVAIVGSNGDVVNEWGALIALDGEGGEICIAFKGETENLQLLDLVVRVVKMHDRDRDIVRANVPLKVLIPNGSAGDGESFKGVAVPAQNSSGEIAGRVEFSYRFEENGTTKAQLRPTMGIVEIGGFLYLNKDKKEWDKSRKFYGHGTVVDDSNATLLEFLIKHLDGEGRNIRFPVKLGGPANLRLNVCVRRHKSFVPDKDIGGVTIKLMDLIDSNGGDESFMVTFPVVQNPVGIFSGQFTFSFRFVEKASEGSTSTSLSPPDQHQPKKRYVAMVLGVGLIGDALSTAAELG